MRRGSEMFASLADPLVLAGWVWGRLYDATGEQRYVGAMRALAVAADRQTKKLGVVQQIGLFGQLRRNQNDEGRGGIVGVGPQSGIAYRPWFRQCCTYSTAFTGAAIIRELNQLKGIGRRA